MALIPTLVVSEPLEIDWGNAIRDRTVHRFANSGERNTALPARQAGALAWLDDIKALTVWDGANWQGVSYNNYVGTIRTGDVQLVHQPNLPDEGGEIRLLSGTAVPNTTWTLDNYRGEFRLMGTGGVAGVALQASKTELDVNLGLVANSTFRSVGAATMAAITASGNIRAPGVHIDNSLYMTPTATAGVDMRPNAQIVLSSGESHNAYFMGETVYLRTSGPGKNLNIQSGLGGSYTIGYFKESGSGSWRSHFSCPIPVLGGGSAVTIQGLGNDQFGRVSSSRRYKINVESVSPDDLMAAVGQMRPVTFNDDPDTLTNATEEERLGMIAEEMAEIDERLVVWGIDPDCDCDIGTWAPDDPKVHDRLSGVHHCWRPEAIDYGRVTVPLIGAVQALSDRLTALEAHVSALVNELTTPKPEVHPEEPEAESEQQQQLEFEEQDEGQDSEEP